MKIQFNEKFITNEKGKRIAVILDNKQYLRIMKLVEKTKVVKLINEGEKEFKAGRIKPIRSLSDLD